VMGPLLLIFGSLWVARIPFAYALAPTWGVDAIWWSFPVGSVVGIALAGLYYRYGGWRKIQLMGGVASKRAQQPAAGAASADRSVESVEQ
jgi:hypothetical protein